MRDVEASGMWTSNVSDESVFDDTLPRFWNVLTLECVRSCDRKPYLHNETKGGICIKIEFNPQKNVSLLQDGRRFFLYSSNMAAVTSREHSICKRLSQVWL